MLPWCRSPTRVAAVSPAKEKKQTNDMKDKLDIDDAAMLQQLSPLKEVRWPLMGSCLTSCVPSVVDDGEVNRARQGPLLFLYLPETFYLALFLALCF